MMVESMFYKSIEDYINTPITDYAIMISGEWGIGKTYFLKNTLLSDFKEKVEKKYAQRKLCKIYWQPLN